MRAQGCLGTRILQAHHIHRRIHWGTRFDPANGLVACRNCHIFYLHRRCLDPPQWYRDHGIEWDALKLRAESGSRKDVDLKLEILNLQAHPALSAGRPAPEPARSDAAAVPGPTKPPE